jgi:glucan phosphoethanolaminetransferase (alkaline phosphatase superfamily)
MALPIGKKYKLNKFLLFILMQIFISTIVIFLFQQTFLLKPILIIGHLFVIASVNILIILVGLLLFSRTVFIFQKVSVYIISSLYAILSILLYYTYIFAFFGKFFSSRIFTLQIVFGYLKHLNELIESFSISYLLVYSVIFIIPVFIFSSILFLTQIVFSDFKDFKRFMLRQDCNDSIRHTVLSKVVILLLFGFVSVVVYLKSSSISYRLFNMEEPFFSFLIKNKDPFNGQHISDKNEDLRIRYEYPKNNEFQKKNIIIIVIDALRSDHLSLFGYDRKTSPFLDSLYLSGSLRKIDLSFSVAGESFSGINGILRSKIWANMGYNNFSIQQLLRDQGYHINFLLSGDHTNFFGLKSFYGKDSDINYFLEGSMDNDFVINDDRIIFKGLDSISTYKDNPSFFQFHLMSVHSIGIRQNQYKRFLPADSKVLNIENYTNRYDNGIIQADDYLKQIFKTLFSKGYIQNSIVVITADHGEALGERGEFGHVKNIYTDQILIPLLIYDSDTVKYKNMKFATSVDIAPTIVDRLGLPIPPSWEGNSLFSEENRDFTFHQLREHYAVIYTKENLQLKYVFDSKTKQEQLFELNTDLYETKNIINSVDSQYVNILRGKLIHFNLDQTELPGATGKLVEVRQ